MSHCLEKWQGVMSDGSYAPANSDTARMDFMELDYHYRLVRVTKAGITVRGIEAAQPSLRCAIDAAIELKKRAGKERA